MAQKMMVVDDLTGTLVEGDQAHVGVSLSFEDQTVSLDLSDESYTALRDALTPYLEAGVSQVRPQSPVFSQRGPSTPQATQAGVTGDKEGLRLVRDWARSKGYKVSERGRVPYSIMDAYTKEHLVGNHRR